MSPPLALPCATNKWTPCWSARVPWSQGHAYDCITPPALQGYDLARVAALKFLEEFKQSVDPGDREVMRCVARTSLRTKLAQASFALDGTTPVADWTSHRIGLCYLVHSKELQRRTHAYGFQGR